MKTMQPTRTVVKCRLAYANVWEPRVNTLTPNAEPKYSAVLLIDKRDQASIDRLHKAVDAAIKAGKAKLANARGEVPTNLHLPMRDADAENKENDGYAGHYFINATNTRKPQIVDRQVAPILEQDEVYSGCYCNVSINCWAYAVNGNKGISVSLGNIQKIRDGEHFRGGRAEDDFEPLSDDEETDVPF